MRYIFLLAVRYVCCSVILYMNYFFEMGIKTVIEMSG